MRHQSDEDFVEFVTSYSGRLQRLAKGVCADPQRAQDLVQETLVATYVKWPKVRGEDPWAYARTCLVNSNISYWRRRPWRESNTADFDEVAEPKSFTDEVDGRDFLLRALATLTARERAVLILRYLEELTERETAETLHMAVGTVKSTCARALSKLNATVGLAHEQV